MNDRTTDQETLGFGDVKVIFRLCPNCGHDNQGSEKIPYCPDTWDMTACARCAFIYLEKSVAYEELLSNMAWEKTSKAEEKRRARSRPISYKFSALTRKRLHLFPRKNAALLIGRYARPSCRVSGGQDGHWSKKDRAASGWAAYGRYRSWRIAAVVHEGQMAPIT